MPKQEDRFGEVCTPRCLAVVTFAKCADIARDATAWTFLSNSLQQVSLLQLRFVFSIHSVALLLLMLPVAGVVVVVHKLEYAADIFPRAPNNPPPMALLMKLKFPLT